MIPVYGFCLPTHDESYKYVINDPLKVNIKCSHTEYDILFHTFKYNNFYSNKRYCKKV